jgi:hypothetical protein
MNLRMNMERDGFIGGHFSGPIRPSLRVALLVGALLIGLPAAGCSTTQGAGGTDKSAVAGPGDTGEDAEASGPTALPDFAPAAGSASIASMAWGADGSLRLGYSDGKWARVDPRTTEAAVDAVISEHHPVVSISPGAKLAFVDSTPPTIIRLRDHQVVLRLNAVEKMRVGGFFADGDGLFVGDKNGTLHVWKKSEDMLDRASTRDLKRLITRQAPDFSAGLSPLSGEVLITPADSLVMATNTGKVLMWKPHVPERVDAVVKLPAAGRSFGLSKRYLAATTVDGALRVVSLYNSVFVPWSMKARGDLVAASTELDGSFVYAGEVDGQSVLGLRAFEDGSFQWKAELPPGEVCGLALSSDASQLAVCVDSGVVLVETSTGKPTGAFRLVGDAIEWKDPR